MLHKLVVDVTHKPYCGPSVVGILTGVPVSHAENLIRRKRRGGYRDRNGRKLPIKGTYRHEVISALKRLGCKVTPVKVFEKTFGKFVRDTAHIAKAYLVNVTGHWMVSESGFIADNSNPNPIAVETYHRNNRRVQTAYQVIAPALPKVTLEDALAASAPKPKKPKPPIQERRAAGVEAKIKKWERRAKLAKTKLKTLYGQRKYYQRQLSPAV